MHRWTCWTGCGRVKEVPSAPNGLKVAKAAGLGFRYKTHYKTLKIIKTCNQTNLEPTRKPGKTQENLQNPSKPMMKSSGFMQFPSKRPCFGQATTPGHSMPGGCICTTHLGAGPMFLWKRLVIVIVDNSNWPKNIAIGVCIIYIYRHDYI